jgi:hypothetical protein
MAYSELAYFDNDYCAHCATRDDHLRLIVIRAAGYKRLKAARIIR